jgi:hypothetical protein
MCRKSTDECLTDWSIETEQDSGKNQGAIRLKTSTQHQQKEVRLATEALTNFS